ncbi:polyprenyl synthetase family protein [Synergistaceae bacterium OttesenSCG-928-I11]|nr:polyprenyl synthetase family protein [Synergistaceae bacterium OttesenSCG-928-I11]
MSAEGNGTGGKSPLKILDEQYVRLFEAHLEEFCKEERSNIPERLAQSMAYSLTAGGKRLRPALCLAAAERCGVAPERALPMAMAAEFIHTASLIHDDLPCMDDDDFRRGKPTNHKVFGEALAVIAGDCMMIWAFSHALCRLPAQGIQPERVLRAVTLLAEGSGPAGMGGGQVLDTDRESQRDDRDFVFEIASMKTGALIRAAVASGAMLGDISDATLQCYYDYGTHLGLAFQIVDDILDVTATKEELGKTPNKDEAQDKRTFVSAYGLDEAKRLAVRESEAAAHALEPLFPQGDLLIDVAKSLAMRTF